MECDLFAEHIDYVEDVCKLISHVAVREADRVRAKHSQVGIGKYLECLKIYTHPRSIFIFMGHK